MKSNKDILFEFLESDKDTTKINEQNKNYYLIRMPYSDSIDVLYITSGYNNNVSIYDKYEYAGIYDRENKELIAPSYTLHSRILKCNYDDSQYKTQSDLYKEMGEQISNIITDYVNENKEEFYEVSDGYKSYLGLEHISNEILNDDYPIEYKCEYKVCDGDEILKYLYDKNSYVYNVSHDHVNKNKKYIGERLRDVDRVNELLKSLREDKDNPIHRRKDIYQKLNDSDCVNVNVFICKDGKKHNFKYDRGYLMNAWNSSYISIYNISAPDRKIYDELYGRNKDFDYDDIYKIEFRNNVIYEDKDFNFDKDNDLEL